jgi:hypothetical protein
VVEIAEEKQFETKVKKFLKELPKCWYFKVMGSMFQRSGIPDIIGCINGRFFGLELKAQRGIPSALQLYNIDQLNKAGAYARIVKPSDWEEVKSDLEKMSRGEMIWL